MRVDLLAGTLYQAGTVPPMKQHPTVLVFDSGLGGLTVFREAVKARPDARFVYAADDAAFPYGRFDEASLVVRIVTVMERLIGHYAPDLVVVACNTASTIALPALRARFSVPFVGTVPAVKPAAEASQSRLISVLGTPGTVKREYTAALIREFAAGCDVTLVGAPRLATLAEAALRGEQVADADLLAEIAPCFVERGERRTDVVTLSCTHYPLLRDRLEGLAPWPVRWIDPAQAIARRMASLMTPIIATDPAPDALAVFTGGHMAADGLGPVLKQFGLVAITVDPLPLH
jgi:glutamate racemase